MNKRLLDILKILLYTNNYITVDEIAKKIYVSNKTVRNDLVILEKFLKEYKLDLYKKTGSGVIILGDENVKIKIFQDILKKYEFCEAYSQEDRKKYILIKLFVSCEKYRVCQISKELYVSRATVHKDLLSLKESLKPFKINLVRDNNGIYLEGSEKNIRKSLFEIIYKNIDYSNFRSLLFNIKNKTDENISNLLLKEIFNYDFAKIEKIVKNILLENNYFPNDEGLIRFLLQLAICIKRINLNKYIILSKDFIQEISFEKSFFIAQKLFDILKNEFNINFIKDEVCYIFVHIQDLIKESIAINKIERDIPEVTEYMLAYGVVKYWDNLLNISLIDDNILINCLYNFFKSILYKKNYGFSTKNTILNDIKNLYPNSYDCAKKSNEILNSLVNCKLNDTEIGYLTLYLVAAIDRAKKPLNTIIVCHSDFSITHLLEQQIKFHFNQLKIIKSISLSAINYTKFHNIDLILTTSDLNINNHCYTLHIMFPLNKFNINRLNNIIEKLYSEKNKILYNI